MREQDEKNLRLTQLMQSALAGNQRVYQTFLGEIARHLKPFLLTRVPPADVDDVLQDILISIHKARHTYDGRRPVLPWVAAIARFRLADYLRRHYAEARYPRTDIAELENSLSADVTEPAGASESISEAVLQLPERQQKILHLMHTEGYTAKEVGAQLGMKESAVKVAAHRAYKLLRTRLKHDGS